MGSSARRGGVFGKTSRFLRGDIHQKFSPKTDQKALTQEKEIEKIAMKSGEKGHATAPTKIYIKGRNIKCEVIIGKGRKKYEKRQVLKDRSNQKTARQTLKILMLAKLPSE